MLFLSEKQSVTQYVALFIAILQSFFSVAFNLLLERQCLEMQEFGIAEITKKCILEEKI